MSPEDERAIEDAVEARKQRAQEDAQAAINAQPKCCSLWWRHHTKDCPNRKYDPEVAEFKSRLWRLASRVLRFWVQDR